LKVGDLAADQIRAEAQRMIASNIGEVDHRIECVFKPDSGNRRRSSYSGIAAHIKNRHAVRLGELVGKRDTKLLAQPGSARRRLRIEIVQIEAREAHTGVGEKSRTEDVREGDHCVMGRGVRVAGVLWSCFPRSMGSARRGRCGTRKSRASW